MKQNIQKRQALINILIPLKLIALTWILSLNASCDQVDNTSKKNILFIAVDDLKPLMGCYGDSIIKTPNIDRLASQGFVFENTHCQQAVCAPSRASILTGKRPDYTKIWDLKTMLRDKNPDIHTMPQYFKQLGYQTAAVGKIFDKRSVDKKHDSISWTIPYENIKQSSNVGGGYIFETRRVSTEAPKIEDSLTMDGDVVKKSNALLKKFVKGEEPFFLAVGFHKPHLPFVAPKKYWDMYDRSDIQLPPFQKKALNAPDYAFQPGWELRSQYVDIPSDFDTPIPEEKQIELIHGYYACVSYIDQQIGNVIDYLDQLGLRDNTVIVLWGDHGWHLGDHDMWCKHTNYEQATRSPLIISVNNELTGSTQKPSEFIDVFPTICELANTKAPVNLDGMSLVPLMNNKIEGSKDFAVSQFTRWPDKMGYSFRNERYRYIIWLKNDYRSGQPVIPEDIDAEELYDYKLDPLETENLFTKENYSMVLKEISAKAIHFLENYEYK